MAFSPTQPLYGQAGSYTAQSDRTLIRANAVTQGVRNIPAAAAGVPQGDLAPTPGASGTVNVATGDVWGSANTSTTLYYAYNNGSLASPAITSNSSGSARTDLLYVLFQDSGVGTPSVSLVVLAGSTTLPPASPPSNYVAGVPIAQVTVANGYVTGTVLTQSQIVDVRQKAQMWDFTTASTSNVASPIVGNLIHDGSVGNLKSFNSQAFLSTASASLAVGTGAKSFTGGAANVSFTGTQRVRAYSLASLQYYSSSFASTTSTTSQAIATGSKTITVGLNLGYVIGLRVRIAQTGTPANFMEGLITAYTAGTGSLTVNVDVVGGSGTIATWTVTPTLVYMEGPTTYSGTTFTMTADTTSGAGTFADWWLYGPGWEQPVKAATAGVSEDGFRYMPTVVGPSTLTPVEQFKGTLWSQPDLGVLAMYDGTTFQQIATNTAWTSWTPTFTGLTLGTGGTNVGAYTRAGKLVMFYVKVVLGTAPAYAALVSFVAPVGTPASAVNGLIYGTRSTTRWQWNLITTASNTAIQIGYPAAGWATAATAGQLTGTMNVAGYPTATAGDVLEISGWYVTT